MWSYFKLTGWAVIWLMAWIIFVPTRKGRGNCLTYALDRWNNDGGYLVIRWCRSNKVKWIKWPHFLWLDETHHRYLRHAVPKEDTNQSHLFPCPWFDPIIKQGDNKHEFKEN